MFGRSCLCLLEKVLEEIVDFGLMFLGKKMFFSKLMELFGEIDFEIV